jgi:hypothetical protein
MCTTHIKCPVTQNLSTECVLKLKLSHYTPRRRLGERIYNSYSFSTSALDGVNGQRHAPAAF